MKRLNPETGKQFKKGDLREDGYRFKEYKLKVKRNGFFQEHWYNQNSFDNHEEYKANYSLTLIGRANMLFLGARSRAVNHNLEFDLSISRILSALEKGICELTNLKFDLNRCEETFKNPYSPSVDRIDSNLGYINSNTRVVLTAVNIALNEFDDATMLPILKEMVKAIEKNAKQNTATPVSEGAYIQGAVGSELGSVSTPGFGEDNHYTHHYSGTICGEDTDHSAKASSGDGMGCRGEKMATLVALTRLENNGEPDAEVVRLDFGGRYLLD